VYRLDEFDFTSADPTRQPTALNYFVEAADYALGASEFLPAAETDAHQINGLRPVSDGTPMVVVYTADTGETVVYAEHHAAGYTDNNLRGMANYVYRLVAVARRRSEGSKPQQARTLEIEPPAAPLLTTARRNLDITTDEVEVIVAGSDAELRVMVKRRLEGSRSWQVVAPWQPFTAGLAFTDEMNPADTAIYAAVTRTPGNRMSENTRFYYVTPLTEA
jgi:hypothetical protein